MRVVHRGPWHRPGRDERVSTEPAHAFRIRPVQWQPGEELRRHAPAPEGVVESARPARPATRRFPQLREQRRIPPYRDKTAIITDITREEIRMDRERARVHVTYWIDQAHHPARPAQVEPGQRRAVRGQVKERVTGQHPLAMRA